MIIKTTYYHIWVAVVWNGHALVYLNKQVISLYIVLLFGSQIHKFFVLIFTFYLTTPIQLFLFDHYDYLIYYLFHLNTEIIFHITLSSLIPLTLLTAPEIPGF